ncbi:predicted protein [Lodderomyces elongisporus NRRL YB-4239]|uniref:Uncharacterized protein n=1 Tax=Lodderomyces elongisporus (strain ATCC 11503 / CBS 2605 / JCM 1781 / NBRC 1676 / NRRL YB-4239) TaxID=379508 RepID=A5DZV1_LODEL|nr:predicted protein [Lodderomyces elongisporus NRRL YB-4239]
MNVCMFVTTYIYLQPNIVSNSVLLAAKGNYKSFHPHFVFFFFIAACSLSFNIFIIHHIDLHLRPGFNHHYQKCIPYFPPPSTPTFAIYFFQEIGNHPFPPSSSSSSSLFLSSPRLCEKFIPIAIHNLVHAFDHFNQSLNTYLIPFCFILFCLKHKPPSRYYQKNKNNNNKTKIR